MLSFRCMQLAGIASESLQFEVCNGLLQCRDVCAAHLGKAGHVDVECSLILGSLVVIGDSCEFVRLG